MWWIKRGMALCVAGRAVFNYRIAAMGSVSQTSDIKIPGPPCYPIVGTLFDIIFDKDFKKEEIHLYFKKLYQKYGSVVRIKYPAQPTMVMVINPEDILTLMQETMDNPVRIPMESLKKARYEDEFYEKKAGIVSENGEEWLRVGPVLRPKIMRPQNVQKYLADVDQVTLDFLQRISELRDSTGEITVDFKEEVEKWSLECICLVSFNQRVGCLEPNLSPGSEPERIVTAAREFMDAIKECETDGKLWKHYPTKMFKQLQHSMDELKETSSKVLDKIESEMKAKLEKDPNSRLNMLEQLLTHKNLTRKDIITFMTDLIPGGTETIKEMAIVILYLLAKNPVAQSKVQEELDRVLGDNTGPLSQHHMDQLSYVKAVVKEANRVLPPALGTVRILQKDVKLRNFILRKGWTVFLMSGLSGLDEAEFKHHEKFLPERWLRHRPYGHIHPCASIPFSYGRRMCIGRRLAEQEIHNLIARMLHRYSIECKHEELQRTHKHVFACTGTIKFTFIDRHPEVCA